MSSITINIRDYDDPAALLHPDPSLTSDAKAIILELDPPNRAVTLMVLSEQARDGTPMEVYHNRKHRLRLPDQTDATQIEGWIEDHSGLIARIFDGHDVIWDGSNNVGKLDEDGSIALDRLRALVSDQKKHPSHRLMDLDGTLPDREYDEVGRRTVDVPTHNVHLFNAGEWMAPARAQIIEDYDITPNTTDEELEQIASELEEEAREEADTKLYNTVEDLRHLRDEHA